MTVLAGQAMGATDATAPAKLLESFEDGIPAGMSATGDPLTLDPDRMKHGRQGLRWDWRGNDALVFESPIGYRPQQPLVREDGTDALDFRVTPGAEMLSPPRGFFMWIHNDEPRPQRLRIQFGRGDEVDCWFDYNLDFKGWRTVAVMYDRGDMRGVPHPDMDRVTINAPATGSGTFYIDSLGLSVPMNPRTVNANRQLPEIDRHARLVAQYPHLLWELSKQTPTFNVEPLTDDDVADFRTLEKHADAIWLPQKVKDGWDDSKMDGIEKAFARFEIRRDGDAIYGRPLLNTNVMRNYFSESGKSTKELMEGLMSWRFDYGAMLIRVARAWQSTQDPSTKARLAEMFLDLYDYGVDQGVAEGAGLGWIHHYSYVVRDYAPAMYLMRDVLRDSGRLDEAIATMKYLHGYNRIYREDVVMDVPGRVAGNADDLQGLLTQRLTTALMMEDSPEKARDLRHFSSYFSNISTGYANALDETFKPDGSVFHHAGQAHGYGGRAIHGVVRTLYALSDTSYAATDEATARIRKVVDTYFATLFGDELSAPKAFASIRFSNYTHPNSLRIAEYFEDGSGEPAMAGRDFVGFRSMPYTGVAMSRAGDDWMITARGHSKYVYPFEGWGTRYFAYPLFVANGYLEVAYPGSIDSFTPPNGTWHDGIDWRRWPGATTVRLPYELMKTRVNQVRDEGGEYLFSDQAFSGGVETSYGAGVFVFAFKGHDKYGIESFTGKKTYFFDGHRVVCLGTDIVSGLAEYEVETTLFQNHLSDRRTPVLVNGERVDGFPVDESWSLGSPTWLIDTRGTGFYVPAQASEATLRLTRGEQEAPDFQGESTTRGDFATAWLDHGRAPAGSSYRYALIAGTDADAMSAFAAGMAGDTPPIEVVQADSEAHVVSWADRDAVAYAVYAEGGADFATGPVRSVSKQSTLMVKAEGEQLRLSLADPDLNIYDGQEDLFPDGTRRELSVYEREWFFWPSRATAVRVTLDGDWAIDRLVEAMETADRQPTVLASGDGQTVIEFVCRDGLSAEVLLSRQ
ncbi:MAG: chondroitinase family polysaccharide lyase [Planctomycetota bacterium]